MRHALNHFAAGEHAGTAVDADGRLTLAPGVGEGTWTGPVWPAPPFDEAMPSWNALTPGQSWTRLDLRLRMDGAWTPWYSLGRWGVSIPRASVAGQDDGLASVQVDYVRARPQADAVQPRLTLARDAQGAAPIVHHLAVHTHIGGSAAALSHEPHAAWGRVLETPLRSQMVEPPDVRGHICSPTSVGMVLAYWGIEQTTAGVCEGVYDHGAGIWGNWPFNAAYAFAASGGRLQTEVQRWDSFRPLEDEIAAGRPVVLSHRWDAGELHNSPIAATRSGHLIVVVGFDRQGDVWVNDPAANPTQRQDVRRLYRRPDVYHTWLKRAFGVVYTLTPVSP